MKPNSELGPLLIMKRYHVGQEASQASDAGCCDIAFSAPIATLEQVTTDVQSQCKKRDDLKGPCDRGRSRYTRAVVVR